MLCLTLLQTTPATDADAPPPPHIGPPATVCDTVLRRPGRACSRWLHSTCRSLLQGALPTATRPPPLFVPLSPLHAILIEYDGGPISSDVSFVMVNWLMAGVGRNCVPRLLVFMAQPTLILRPSRERVTRSPFDPRIICIDSVGPPLPLAGLNWHHCSGIVAGHNELPHLLPHPITTHLVDIAIPNSLITQLGRSLRILHVELHHVVDYMAILQVLAFQALSTLAEHAYHFPVPVLLLACVAPVRIEGYQRRARHQHTIGRHGKARAKTIHCDH